MQLPGLLGKRGLPGQKLRIRRLLLSMPSTRGFLLRFGQLSRSNASEYCAVYIHGRTLHSPVDGRDARSIRSPGVRWLAGEFDGAGGRCVARFSRQKL
jgi:hypothetical protein